MVCLCCAILIIALRYSLTLLLNLTQSLQHVHITCIRFICNIIDGLIIYLGSLVNNTNNINEEIKWRIQLANRSYFELQKQFRPKSKLLSRVTKCVCSNANPLHYYALQVPRKVMDGVKCGLFSNHAPLGRTTLRVGRVSV